MAVDTLSTSVSGVGRNAVADAIQRAAASTSTRFEYLVATAKMESNFRPSAQASTSSARGLFQFIDQTWLSTMKEAGPSLGFGRYADAITRRADGSYGVSDPAARRAIMNLRDDPSASAAMAGALTQSNSFRLTGKIGRRPTDGELYIAHFMGVGGAAKLITSAENAPNASGAALFPNAAAANRPIFYDRAGRARSVSEVYTVLTTRYASAANSASSRAMVASAGSATTATDAAQPVDNAAYLSAFPAQVAAAVPPAQATNNPPLVRAGPVAPVVQQLWGNGASLTQPTVTINSPIASRAGLDLFSDPTGRFSG
jgi:hypothetical protein